MTCDDYLSVLATAPVNELGKNHLREHAAGCPYCERVTRVVVEREWELVAAFESVYSNTPAAVTADIARTTARRRLVDRMYSITLAILLAGTAWFAATRLVFRGRADGPAVAPVAEEVFMVRCLSSAQVVALSRHYLGRTGLAIYAGEPPRAVLTVRATPAQIEEVRSMLNRFDGSAQSSCPPAVASPLPR